MAMIECSTKCSCGGFVLLSDSGGWADQAWRARCSECYDPSEGSSELACAEAFAATPERALALWQESHDEALDVVTKTVRAQCAQEFERVRDWRLREEGKALLYSPPERTVSRD